MNNNIEIPVLQKKKKTQNDIGVILLFIYFIKGHFYLFTHFAAAHKA